MYESQSTRKPSMLSFYLIFATLCVPVSCQQRRPRLVSWPNHPSIGKINGNASFDWSFELLPQETWNRTIYELIFGVWKYPGYLREKLIVIDAQGKVLIRQKYEKKISCKFNMSRLQVTFTLHDLKKEDQKDYGLQVEFGVTRSPLTDNVTLRIEVAAKDYTANTLQDYTRKEIVYTIGETAKLFPPRSKREDLKEFRMYRTWKNDLAFAILNNTMLKKGVQTANCLQNDLQQFCLKKVELKILNDTHLILEINDTTLNDSGNYSVEHVFGELEGNFKETISLKIEAKSTGLSTPSQERPTIRPSARASTGAGRVSFTLLKRLFVLLFVLHFIL